MLALPGDESTTMMLELARKRLELVDAEALDQAEKVYGKRPSAYAVDSDEGTFHAYYPEPITVTLRNSALYDTAQPSIRMWLPDLSDDERRLVGLAGEADALRSIVTFYE